MPIIIKLPQVGESVTEGIIGKWLVRSGARVEKYDPLVEVMTDKVNMEVPSPFSGTLVRILAEEGETVSMGAPIAEMEVEGEVLEREGVSSWPLRASEQAKEERDSGREGDEHAFEFMEDVRSVGPTGSGEGGRGRPTETTSVEGQQRLSPLVQRLVAQYGVDVALVHGTGAGGRITKQDLLRYVETPGKSAQHARASADVEEELLTPLRRSIAEQMTRGVREVPAAWTMMEMDLSGLVACRERVREEFQRCRDVPLTVLSFILREVAGALKEHPKFNSRWGGDRIYVSRRVHVGIAVATAEGLVVPVVHDADGLGVGAIAERIHDLAGRARLQKLRLEDMQGGTFTVNNTGALGSVASYPIINYPQAAILTTEAIIRRLVVTNDGILAVRSMMNVGLTFDHRVGDGADAAAFLAEVKSRLQAFTRETLLT